MAALLEVRGLDAFYGQTQALFGVRLDVQDRGITALLGANGAGKTTTLRAICGMVRSRGSVRFDGEEILGRAAEDVARRGIAHVQDGRGTFNELSVEENLRLGGYLQPRARVAAAMEQVFGYFPVLKARIRQQAGTLSGGEQQMLAISRALMTRPRLIVLDEPSFGLAPLIVQEIFRIIERINATEGVAILVVEQNARQALKLAQHAFLLEAGSLVGSGTTQAMLADEGVRRAYLGH